MMVTQENILFINHEDMDYKNKQYKVSLHNYDNEWFYVHANHEQEALDIVVDDLEKKNQTGFFVRSVPPDEEENYIVAGNYCWYLDAEHTMIREVE